MKFLTIILMLMSLFLVNCSSLLVPVQLARYANKDIRGLDRWTKYGVTASIDKLTGINPQTDDFESPPWYIWKQKTDHGEIRYILFEAKPLAMNPGQSEARIHVFDDQWQIIYKTRFSTGWRMELVNARFKDDPSLGTKIIELRTEPGVGGGDIARQIYALVNDRIALLRIEDSNGNIIRNTYSYPNHRIGPPVPIRTIDEWRMILDSGTLPEVLEALVWISGDHLHPAKVNTLKINGDDIYDENIEQARTIEGIRNSSRIRYIVAGLTHSENVWIAEAAALALKAE